MLYVLCAFNDIVNVNSRIMFVFQLHFTRHEEEKSSEDSGDKKDAGSCV